MNIFQRIKQAKADATESDLSRYYKLLASVDVNDPKDEDHAQLDVLLSRLGKTITDAEADRQKIVQIQNLIAGVKATADAGNRRVKSYEQHQSALLQRQKTFQEQNTLCAAAGAIYQQNEADCDHNAKSRGELVKLRDHDPLLFAAVAGEDAKSLKL